ncbi:MAG: extracellular solute-binding protein [Roseburia sp.]|nr:extracellular solute-binding protein [Roseburia sp.]MCM1097140.1 extracellular solute-binding protein [Ruminococcus flavefaciens]
MGNLRWKKILGAGLAFALAVGLCACGDGSSEGNQMGNPGAGNGKEAQSADGSGAFSGADSPGISGGADGKETSGNFSNANSALAKQNVYRVNEVKIPSWPDYDSDSIGVESMTYRDGRISIVLKAYDWENGHRYGVFSIDGEGKPSALVPLERLEEKDGGAGSDAGAEAGVDEVGSGEGASHEKAGAEEAQAASEPDPDVWEREEARYSDFVAGAGGRIYGICQYRYSYANYRTDQYREEEHQYVCCWDSDGSLLWRTDIGGDGGEDLSVWALFPSADGSLEILLSGKNAYRLIVAEDGSLSEAGKETLSEETGKALKTCRRLIRKEEGSCLLLCRGADGDYCLAPYDLSADRLGESFPLPGNLEEVYLSSTVFAAGADCDLIYAGRDGVFAYEKGKEQADLKMDYVNSDRYITEVFSLQALDETRFCLLFKEDYGRELKCGIFEYVRPEDIPDKAVVVLGGLIVNGGIKNRAVQYNRESDKYRVVVREYASVGDLNLEIAAGRMPDILIPEGLSTGERPPMESYIARGLIADVGKLIEEDVELSGTKFLENVFEAYSVDGTLRYVVPSFTLSTMAARTANVGDGSDWSMERMQEILAEMGSRTQLLDGLNQSAFLEKALEYRGNDFVDRKTGKCAFDSPEFIELLRFAGTLPEEGSYAGERGEGEYERQYLKDRTLLMELSIWSFDREEIEEPLSYRLNGFLGGEYTFVGFPGSFAENMGEGSGAVIRGWNCMALSARSESLAGAWDFARYYLTEEYQRKMTSSLPVNRQVFEEWAVKQTERVYVTDENGERVELDVGLYLDGGLADVPPLSREQLDQVLAYMESVTTAPFEDRDLLNIIREEAGSFFSGQKSAEDAAAVIQRRAQMYVQENL